MTSPTVNKLNYVRLNYVLKPQATAILRELFKNHWFNSLKTNWTENDAKQFIEGKGKDIYISSSRKDKILLRSGRLDLWNLNLLGDVLLKYDFGKSFKPNKRVKTLIKTLLETCADVNARPNQEIDSNEFDSAWQIIEDVLIKLGDSTDKLKKLKTEKLHSTEMKNKPKNEQSFRELGNKFYDQEKFREAIICYTQGIEIERCKIESAMLYSNRASTYLKSYKMTHLFICQMERASDDFINAIELCPTWYKPHYKLALIFEEGRNYKECKKLLELALVFNFKNQTIRNKLIELDRYQPDCYELAAHQEAELCETIWREFLGESYGTDRTAKSHVVGPNCQSQIPEKLYSKAIESGKGRVMVDMAMVLRNGPLWDSKKSIKLYRKVISNSRFEKDDTVRSSGEEIGLVGIAARKLGEVYEKGLGVIVDFKAAMMWYEKAWSLGNLCSAWKLGLFHMTGSGVEKNEERGVLYWKLAADKGLIKGCTYLAIYYFESELDADEASRWHKKLVESYGKFMETARKVGEVLSKFEDIAERLRRFVDLDKISRWEKEKGFSVEGLSVKERRWRYVYDKVPNMDKIETTVCQDFFGNYDLGLIPCINVLKKYMYPNNLYELKELAEKVSVTAKRMELDADEASRWHKKLVEVYGKFMEIMRKFGEGFSELGDKVEWLRRFVDLDEISRWEKEKGFSVEGLSVKERRWRYVYDKVPNMDEIETIVCRGLFGNCVELGLIPSINVDQVLRKDLNELKELAEKGSVTAKRMEKAVIHFGNALKCLNVNSKSLPIRLCLITELSQCLQTEPSVAEWKNSDREKVALIVDEVLSNVATMNYSIEIACCVCYSYFHTNECVEMKKFLLKCIEKYPEEVYFSKTLVNTMVCHGDFTQGLQECDKLLKKLPGDCDLLLNRAKLLRGLKEDPTEVIKAFEDFTLSAPKDHPDVPAAYYEIAIHYFEPEHCKARDKVKEYIRKGYEAEKSQLPCFLPYKFRNDDRFKELCLSVSRMSCPVPPNEGKLAKLMDPSRVESIVSYREKLANTDKIKEIEDYFAKKFEPRSPPQLAEMKFISLSEMKDVKDQLLEGFAAKLTIIEDIITSTCVHLLVEDEEFDVSHVVICDYRMEDEVEKNFAYGSKVVIMNPITKSIEGGKTVLVIEDVKSLSFVYCKSKLCRFCRSENAKKKCGICRKVNYCSKECQLNDWNVMKHNICCRKL